MKRTIVILIALSLALAGLLAYRNGDPIKKVVTTSSTSGYASTSTASSVSSIDADKFLVPELYEPAWSTPVETTPCRSYRGAIVNHHALASDLIVKIVRELARCRPEIKTVIILSPDHYNAGSSSITVHRKSYSTAGDFVSIDEKSVGRLLDLPEVGWSEALFDREHGVGVLIPFLHRALPKIEIVPIVVKATIKPSELAHLASWLSIESKLGNFILVSSDMSHYLDDSIAIKNDERTKRALADLDSNFFSTAKDNFTDNGPSIAATIDALHPKRWQLIDQTISSDYSGSSGFTTTYLVGFWD